MTVTAVKKSAQYTLRTNTMKKALREMQTLHTHALAVVRFRHSPPAVTTPQTGLITTHCAAARAHSVIN